MIDNPHIPGRPGLTSVRYGTLQRTCSSLGSIYYQASSHVAVIDVDAGTRRGTAEQ